MNRTQIYLSEPQHLALTALARQRGTTASALIRLAIDGYLTSQQTPRERVDRLRQLASRFASTAGESTGAESVESLRAADSDRLSSRG